VLLALYGLFAIAQALLALTSTTAVIHESAGDGSVQKPREAVNLVSLAAERLTAPTVLIYEHFEEGKRDGSLRTGFEMFEESVQGETKLGVNQTISISLGKREDGSFGFIKHDGQVYGPDLE
jgi:hypothetical protein